MEGSAVAMVSVNATCVGVSQCTKELTAISAPSARTANTNIGQYLSARSD